MKGTLIAALLGAMILLFSLSVPLWARTDADEAQLDAIRKDIDRDSSMDDADKIRSLAEQFQVAPETVRALRAGKQGWGETGIELAMARHLIQADPAAYPTMTEALNRIEGLRGQKMGWGKIAGYLGLKLGPVVSAAHRLRHELRRGFVPGEPALPNAGMPAKPETAARAERPAKPERVSHPERPMRPERAARVH